MPQRVSVEQEYLVLPVSKYVSLSDFNGHSGVLEQIPEECQDALVSGGHRPQKV